MQLSANNQFHFFLSIFLLNLFYIYVFVLLFYLKLKKYENDYSKDGALEFWSSGGLMQTIDPSGRPEAYDYVNINPKHIEVIILAKGKAAVAMYYSEGNMKPKNSSEVSHYLTRVSQTFDKEDGEWKPRTSHWSPVMGGSGTSQTGKE